MISPLVRWDHNEDYFVTKYENQRSNKSGERRVVINLSELDYEFIEGHTIDGEVCEFL
jgi:fatty acid synthase